MEETMSTDAASAPPPSDVTIRYLADLNPIPYLRAYLDGQRRPDDRRFWFDRGDRDGQCLIFTEDKQWVLFHIDFRDLYRSFDVSDEPGHSEAHGNDDVEKGLGRLTEGAAASWLVSNGYVLPKRLRGRALDGDLEVGQPRRRSKRRLIRADEHADPTKDSNGQLRQTRLRAVLDKKPPYLILDGTPLTAQEVGVYYVAALIRANGEHVSFAGFLKKNPRFEGAISTRVLDQLPKQIQALIQRDGKGSPPRLKIELLESVQ
jgi:hypothetical protein